VFRVRLEKAQTIKSLNAKAAKVRKGKQITLDGEIENDMDLSTYTHLALVSQQHFSVINLFFGSPSRTFAAFALNEFGLSLYALNAVG